jgi:hypothetical protein
MGCCLFASILAGAPRLASIIWWLFQPVRWSVPFGGWPIVWWLWPTAGILLVPWTTLMYVIVYPGGLSVINWIFLGLAVAMDVGSYAGGQRSYSNR